MKNFSTYYYSPVNDYNMISEASSSLTQGEPKWEDYDVIVCLDGEKIDMAKVIQDQVRAQAVVVGQVPFFGAYVSVLKIVYTFRVATQATDGVHLFINPQFTSHLDFQQKCFVLCHELMHCLLLHIERFEEGQDHDLCNIAADYECNITLAQLSDIERGHAPNIGLFPISVMQKTKALVDKKYIGWSYEKIYDDIVKTGIGKALKNMVNNAQSQGQGQGQGQGSSPSYSKDYQEGWEQAVADWKAGKLSGVPGPSTSTANTNTNQQSGGSLSDADIEDQIRKLKHKRSNLYQNIRYGKRKGNDVSEAEAQMAAIDAQIAALKNKLKGR